MFAWKRIVIADYERGLLWQNKHLKQVLIPGVHRYLDPCGRIEVTKHDVTEPELVHPRAAFLAKSGYLLIDEYFERFTMADTEVGLVYKDRKLTGVIAPGGTQLYWRGLTDVQVERQDISESYEVSPQVLKRITRPREVGLLEAFQSYLYVVEVADTAVGILTVNGEFVGTLAPGIHGYWTFNRRIAVEMVDRRLQTMEVSGQEILTGDKVSIRANLSATYQIIDPVKARTEVAKPDDYLYRELQFGLRQAIGSRTLEEMLADKSELDDAIFNTVRDRISKYGLQITGVGIKDVILPGEMKTILNQVVEAEKAAQANVIKRREETSATRSLLNTAKLMDEHPTLMRLKELEALEKITGKIDRLTVFGGLDGVLNDTVRIAVDGR